MLLFNTPWRQLPISSRLTNRGVCHEKGAQVIEFIAVVPFLVFAVILAWQFAIFFYATMVAASAAEAGARAVALGGSPAVVSQAVRRGSAGLEYTYEPEGACTGRGDMVAVTVIVRVPFATMPFADLGIIPTQSTASAWCEDPRAP